LVVGAGLKRHFVQHPLLRSLVVFRLYDQFALRVCSVRYYFKVNIVLERIHLAVAGHYLEISSKDIGALLVLLHVGNCLVVNYTVRD
jgi:hypothetical protein